MGIGELYLNYGNDSCLNFEKSIKRKSAQNNLNELCIFESFEIGTNILKMDYHLLGKGSKNHLTKVKVY